MTERSTSDEKARSRALADPGGSPLSPEATRQVLHDLRVHQIELEMQNDQLRQTQLQLEASRARYFDLYDLAPVGYFTLGSTGLIEEANFTAAGILGVARGALVKQHLTRFIAWEDQDVYYHRRKQLVETGQRQVCELRMVRSDGALCWVQFEATSATDVSGELVCRAVVSDITARKHAEETHRASEARHRILFEKSHDALMTLAPPEWRFASGNATTLAMFGAADASDFLSRAPSEYSPLKQPNGGASTEKVALMIEAALRDGSHYYEWTYRRLSGQEFPATVLLTRIDIDGQPLLQATVRDETEVKRLHAMLRQADRLSSMGMLAAGVAHEINNPLLYILYNIETVVVELPKIAAAVDRCLGALRVGLGDEAFAAVLGDDAGLLEPSTLRDIIERAREALEGTQRIKSISRAIGTFSRVESTERSAVDLNFAIECAATMAMSDIKFRAQLVLDLGVLPAVWASAGKLSQVVLNLLLNAAHAIDEGNVQHNFIRVRTWSQGDDVFIEVTDTGEGISEESIERIFEPFFTTKPVGVGSGLGLPICQSILSEFGGDIQVKSELGKGTTFIVRLPRQKGAPVARRETRRSEAPAVARVRGRVMVVDDEPAIRATVVRMLGQSHEIVTAASGEAARLIIERDRAFDVILCDLMMPETTGMALHMWLAAEHPSIAEKVVFVTGGAFTPKASDYVASVGNLRIEKPYEAAKLERLVFELVAAARGVVD